MEKIIKKRKEDDDKLKKIEERYGLLEKEKKNNLKEWKSIESRIEKLWTMNEESWTKMVKKSIKEVVIEKR